MQIYKIAMSKFSYKPKMIMWVFHPAVKKQIITR
jgi:hypothetical protein